ncbi:hypothetical protein [Anabaena azotica]|uniref:Uncharacterized protein n=1 Tax=Anabaena azotica FACHB-119 TaxID=947527 RepID=A0ABR8DBV0_9NOST|nr:hypothetical protein [Anabaena azotica]MBD2503953.1 hypothetical protein [Anabaena azotica FACHB-119]
MSQLNLSQVKVCRDCSQEFMSYFTRGAWLCRCPQCSDVAQRRPSVVQERNLVYSRICKLESLPKSWQRFQASPKDAGCWKIELKGGDWGATWLGRIDIYSLDTIAPHSGQIVLFEELESVHKILQQNAVVLEKRKYVRISAAGMQSTENLPRLVWLQARTKTTLKGYGRQYRYDIVGSPLWEWRVKGGVRSGRSYIEGALAIVDDEHPLMMKEIFNH